jgi:hypothetical protein
MDKTFMKDLKNTLPDILEPITKPSPVITPAPSQDDPFNVPAPLVDPTPKGFL